MVMKFPIVGGKILHAVACSKWQRDVCERTINDRLQNATYVSDGSTRQSFLYATIFCAENVNNPPTSTVNGLFINCRGIPGIPAGESYIALMTWRSIAAFLFYPRDANDPTKYATSPAYGISESHSIISEMLDDCINYKLRIDN
jgi:hypothetical protein